MNIEEEQRLLDAHDHVDTLASIAQVEGAASIVEVVQLIATDIVWLIEKVRQHDREKNHYKEELQLILEGTHSEP